MLGFGKQIQLLGCENYIFFAVVNHSLTHP